MQVTLGSAHPAYKPLVMRETEGACPCCGQPVDVTGVPLFVWDEAKVYVGKRVIDLTYNEADILRVLAEHAGKRVPLEKILREVYGQQEDYPQIRCIYVYISRIRKKFREVNYPIDIQGDRPGRKSNPDRLGSYRLQSGQIRTRL